MSSRAYTDEKKRTDRHRYTQTPTDTNTRTLTHAHNRVLSQALPIDLEDVELPTEPQQPLKRGRSQNEPRTRNVQSMNEAVVALSCVSEGPQVLTKPFLQKPGEERTTRGATLTVNFPTAGLQHNDHPSVVGDEDRKLGDQSSPRIQLGINALGASTPVTRIRANVRPDGTSCEHWSASCIECAWNGLA